MRNRKLILLIIATIFCLFLTSIASASTEEDEKDAAQLKMEEFEAELGEEGMQEVDDYLALQASLPDVVKGMPYSWLAFAATEPENHHIYMEQIDNFDVSKKEKDRYKAGLQDVWDRYPFNITRDDYPFMAEVGPLFDAEFAKREGINMEDMPDDTNSQLASSQNEQKIAPGFTGMMGAVIVMICFYFARRYNE